MLLYLKPCSSVSYTGMSTKLIFVSVTVVQQRIFTVIPLLDVFYFTDFLILYSFHVALNSH